MLQGELNWIRRLTLAGAVVAHYSLAHTDTARGLALRKSGAVDQLPDILRARIVAG